MHELLISATRYYEQNLNDVEIQAVYTSKSMKPLVHIIQIGSFSDSEERSMGHCKN